MGAVLLVVFVIAILGSLAFTGLGFRPARPFANFAPDRSVPSRRFVEPPDRVLRAYTQAAERTPGMRTAPAPPGYLYVDCRPTARILNGDFGTAVRLEFRPHGGGTQVGVDAQAKTWGPTRASTLRELERALRMRAKQLGLTESIPGVEDHGDSALPESRDIAHW